jgi:hypothetical protein
LPVLQIDFEAEWRDGEQNTFSSKLSFELWVAA